MDGCDEEEDSLRILFVVELGVLKGRLYQTLIKVVCLTLPLPIVCVCMVRFTVYSVRLCWSRIVELKRDYNEKTLIKVLVLLPARFYVCMFGEACDKEMSSLEVYDFFSQIQQIKLCLQKDLHQF